MNCRETEPLIPLFIEADLAEAEMQQVRAHLAACSACGERVAEFQASQAFLRAAALPAFDETMLRAMRKAVLEQVDQSATQPMLGAWWQPIWNWKFAFAAAAVILLVAGVALRQRGAKPVDNQAVRDAKETTSATLVVNKDAAATAPSVPQRLQPRAGRKHRSQGGVNASERNPGSDATKQLSPARATDADTQIAAAAIAPFGAGENTASLPGGGTPGFMLPPASQAENSAFPSTEKSAPEPEMLRIEIQTADPNIRIIWLTPKSALASK